MREGRVPKFTNKSIPRTSKVSTRALLKDTQSNRKNPKYTQYVQAISSTEDNTKIDGRGSTANDSKLILL